MGPVSGEWFCWLGPVLGFISVFSESNCQVHLAYPCLPRKLLVKRLFLNGIKSTFFSVNHAAMLHNTWLKIPGVAANELGFIHIENIHLRGVRLSVYSGLLSSRCIWRLGNLCTWRWQTVQRQCVYRICWNNCWYGWCDICSFFVCHKGRVVIDNICSTPIWYSVDCVCHTSCLLW